MSNEENRAIHDELTNEHHAENNTLDHQQRIHEIERAQAIKDQEGGLI